MITPLRSEFLERGRGRWAAVFLLVVAASLPILVAPAAAQGVDAATGERLFGGYTEAEIQAMTPTSPNPYISFVLDAAAPDYRYWNARIALESYRRAERRGELSPPARLLSFEESEATGTTGANETYATAEFVAGFGTGSEDDSAVTITGSLLDDAVTVEAVGPFAEDDGSIPLASNTGLEVGDGLIVQGAEIGDGPHGATTGDFDYYAVTATAPSQTIRLQMFGDLNVVLYDESGTALASNLFRFDTGRPTDFPVAYRVAAPGTYYAAVFGNPPALDIYPFLADPLDPASGPGPGTTGTYDLSISLLEHDVDVFAFDLEAGDVLGVGEGTGALGAVEIFGPDGSVMVSSDRPVSFFYPEDSPLPSEGDVVVGASTVAHEAGRYAVAVRSTGSGGPYAFGVHAFRPRTETEEGATQVLFVDFDGATIDAEATWGEGNPEATLSPLAAFMADWGFEPSDEDELIDRIMAVLEENLVEDMMEFSNNPNTGVVLQNSRDHADPGAAPYVSRLIVGGTIEELGITVSGIASAIDPGNFGLEDVGVILLDRFSAPADEEFNSLNAIEIAPGAEKLDLVATAVGNLAAHEAGHFLGLWHTDGYNPVQSVQDEVSQYNFKYATGIGPDLVFGTADDVDLDFLTDRYSLFEAFVGVEDQVNVVAFGLTESPAVATETGPPDATAVTPLYPNPLAASGVATLEVRTTRDEHVRVSIYDTAGRLVRTAFEGRVAQGQPELVRIAGRDLASGVYLVRVEGERESAVRRLTVVR